MLYDNNVDAANIQSRETPIDCIYFIYIYIYNIFGFRYMTLPATVPRCGINPKLDKADRRMLRSDWSVAVWEEGFVDSPL